MADLIADLYTSIHEPPTNDTPELTLIDIHNQIKVTDLFMTGASLRTALSLAGVSTETAKQWISRASEDEFLNQWLSDCRQAFSHSIVAQYADLVGTPRLTAMAAANRLEAAWSKELEGLKG